MTELIQQGQSGGNAVTAKRATFAYNVLNQRTLVSRYQSTGTTNAVATTEYSYDTLNRLSGLTHKQGSTVLSGYTYTYDGMSRLAGVTSTIEGLSSYSYDATSQVVGADHASGGQADESYSFDANGNRNSVDYTVDTNNHITADATFTYSYDDQGNRTSRTDTTTGEVTEYSWDHRNRLVTVKDRASSGGSVVKQVDYAYDAFNRLVKRTYDADGAGSGTATTQYWVYDEGINAVMQFDGASSSNLSHRYLWTDVVDELMADEILGSGADTQYALGDHLGTIRDIANFSESTSVTSVTNHTYSSYGQLTAETNSAIDLLFGYTGKQLDDATGLQHNLFRWYDSALGQWLSEDPLGFAAGDENLKRYVGNDVVRLTDYTGLKEFKIGGWVFYVHPNDPDPHPSDPHAHINSPNSPNKVHIDTGEIYEGGKATGTFIHKKVLATLREKMQRAGLLGVAVAFVLVLPDAAYAAETEGAAGLAKFSANYGKEALIGTATSYIVGAATISTASTLGYSLTVSGTVATAGFAGAATIGGCMVAAFGAGFWIGNTVGQWIFGSH